MRRSVRRIAGLSLVGALALAGAGPAAGSTLTFTNTELHPSATYEGQPGERNVVTLLGAQTPSSTPQLGNAGAMLIIDSGASITVAQNSPTCFGSASLGGCFGLHIAYSTYLGDSDDTITSVDLPVGAVSDIYLGEGDDTARSVVAQYVDGGPGNDRVYGGLSGDTLVGGEGDDLIDARGGGSDVVVCDDGEDTAIVDSSDYTLPGCEHVTVD